MGDVHGVQDEMTVWAHARVSVTRVSDVQHHRFAKAYGKRVAARVGGSGFVRGLGECR